MSRKDDLISRQAAIEVLELAIADDWEFGYAKDRMNELPSVQPEIIRCKDCKYTDDDGVCQHSMALVIQDDDDFCSRAER